MPWSAKAHELLRSQYAAVGAAGNASLPFVVSALEQAANCSPTSPKSGSVDAGPNPNPPISAKSAYGEQAAGRLNGDAAEMIGGLLTKYRDIRSNVGKFVSAYRQYCWSVASLDDLRLAPFHLLATEGQVHTHQKSAR